MRNISDLHPQLQELVKKLQNLCASNGLIIGIGECLRTKEEQDELYAKGRTKKGQIVTNAKGSTFQSMHQWGVAFDFYRNDGKGAYNTEGDFFEKVGKLGKSLGLMWGGDFKSFVDKPHFQLPDWGSSTAILKKNYKTPENFIKTWEDNFMTAEEKQKFDELSQEVEKLKADKEKVYRYTMELPDWARPTVQKLVDKGIYLGASKDNIDLPEGLMRMLVINDRAGIYE